MEILEARGYFVNYETNYTASPRWADRQLKVLQGKLKPEKSDPVVFVGPNRRSRFFRRWKLKRSGQRVVTFTPLKEVFEETRIPMAQCFAYRIAFGIQAKLVANTIGFFLCV